MSVHLQMSFSFRCFLFLQWICLSLSVLPSLNTFLRDLMLWVGLRCERVKMYNNDKTPARLAPTPEFSTLYSGHFFVVLRQVTLKYISHYQKSFDREMKCLLVRHL